MSAKVIVIEFAPKPAKEKRTRRPTAKPPKKSERALLLEQLRRESRIRSGRTWRTIDKQSLLFSLANAAMYSSKRHITWRNIRFPLRHSWWLQVLDPETGEILVQTSGGVL